MANRYWVGGTATWDATAGTKWSDVSGGAGGQAVPTSADDVFFDAASGAVTVTTSGTLTDVCRSLTFTGFSGTFNHVASTIVFIGNSSGGALTMSSGMTYTVTSSSTMSFVSTSNNGGTGWAITTSGKAMGAMSFSGIGGKWVLQDAVSSSGNFALSAGTLETNNNSIACNQFSLSGSSSRVFSPGSSSITPSLTTNAVNIGTSTNLSFSANTAVVTISSNSTARIDLPASAGTTVDTNGMSFVFSAGVISTGSGHIAGAGATLIIKDLTITGSSSSSTSAFVTLSNLTITGTLTINSGTSSHTRRILLTTGSPGLTKAIVCNGSISASYLDIQDITASGSASWDLSGITGGSGDAGGNSGITFTTPVTRYGVVAGNWSNTATWSATSGGSGGASVPLCHDDVYLNASSAAGTYTMDIVRIAKDLNCTGFTRTLGYIGGCTIYGSLTMGSGMSQSATAILTVAGRGSHTITSNGVSHNGLTINCGGGSYTLQDATTTTVNGLSVTSGTLNSNNQSITIPIFASTGTLTRSINLGTSSVTLNSGNGSATLWNFATTTGATTSFASSTINISSNAAGGSQTFASGGLFYGSLVCTNDRSTHPIIFTGSGIFTSITVDPGHQINLTNTTTQSANTWSVSGEVRDHIYFSGVAQSGQFITTPDHADLDLTGDYDFIAKVAPATWASAQTILNKQTGFNSETSYAFEINSNATLRVIHFSNASGTSTSAQSSVTLTSVGAVTNGQPKWIRAARTGSTVQFFYGDDGSSWTQLGSNQTNSTTMYSGTGSLGLAAQNNNSGAQALNGKLYRVIIKSSQDGTIVADFDPSLKTFGADTYTDTTGKVWTLNGQSVVGDGRVKIISTSGGSPAFISIPRTDSLGNTMHFLGKSHFRSGNYLRSEFLTSATSKAYVTGVLGSSTEVEVQAKAAFDVWTTASLVQFAGETGVSTGWGLHLTTGAGAGNTKIGFSINGTRTDFTAFAVAAGATKWIKVTWRKSDGQCILYKSDDGSSWTLVESRTLASGTDLNVNSSNRIEIGSINNASSDGNFYRLIVKNGINGTSLVDMDFESMTNSAVHPIIFRNVTLQDNYVSGQGLAYAV